jgi:hypothetical protein
MNGVDIIKSLGDELDVMLKDIPVEHIVKGVQVFSRALYIRYFKGYRLQVAGKKRVRALVDREIGEKDNEELSQLLMTLWNRANGRLYHAMYNKIRTVNEEVDKIERIEDDAAGLFLDELMEEGFDAARLYMCILFNEVKFSKEIITTKLERTVPFAEWPPEPVEDEEEVAEDAEDVPAPAADEGSGDEA